MLKWLNRQKIGTRIIIGFGSLLAVMVVTALISLGTFGNTILGITEYKNISDLNNQLVLLESRMLITRLRAMEYMKSPMVENSLLVVSDLRDVRDAYNKINLKKLSKSQKESLEEIAQIIQKYDTAFNTLVTNQTEMRDLIDQKMTAMAEALKTLIDDSIANCKSSSEAVAVLNQIYGQIMNGCLYTEKYIRTNDPMFSNAANTHFKDDLGTLMTRADAIENKNFQIVLPKLKTSISEFLALAERTNTLMTDKSNLFEYQMVPISSKISMIIESLRTPILKQQITQGNTIHLLSRASFLVILLINSICILFGIIGSILLVKNISGPLIRMISQLSRASNQVAAASEEISSASTQLASGATQQASSIEETSASMEEMSAQASHNVESSKKVLESIKDIANLIEQNAQKAVQAAQISEQSKDSAIRGETAINDISHSMDEIRHGSEQITNIISTINDIAQQTKMLAVNAAIEAARAGEHGQGFAVVADQVSKLAETSKSASREIEILIRESVHKAEAGTLVSEKGTEAIREILSRIKEISLIISQISNSSQQAAAHIQQVTNQTHGITEATIQGSLGIEQINSAIRQIDSVTQLNSSSSEQTSSAAARLHGQAQSLIEIVEELNAMVTGNGDLESDYDTEDSAQSRTDILPGNAAPLLPGKIRRALPYDAAYLTPRPETAASISPEDIIPMRADFSDFQEQGVERMNFTAEQEE